MSTQHLEVAADWARTQVPGGNILLAALADLDLQGLKFLLTRVVADVPRAVALSVWGTMFFTVEEAGEMLCTIAEDSRAEVREHLFSLLSGHRRIVPPGTLKSPTLTDDDLARLVRRGIVDPVGKVRERAISYAYGRGVVAQVRDLVEVATRDPEVGVRQYALVALGVLDDPDSLRILRRALQQGDDAEARSAIWALARRPDGLADVVALASDARGWVREEMLGAIAEVSAPLDDDQMRFLAATIATPAVTQALARHTSRTQRGVPERGPDMQVTAVRRDT